MGQTIPPFRQCQFFESAWSLCQVNSSMHQVSGYVNYNIGMEPEVSWIEQLNIWINGIFWTNMMLKRIKCETSQVVWRVLLPPGQDLWRVGDQGGTFENVQRCFWCWASCCCQLIVTRKVMVRQGTSSQYQYCYLDLVIWYYLSAQPIQCK